MNRLAFQTYGTKKLSLFQSIWNTTETSAVGTELANTAATTPLPVGWAGANLLTGGYTHTAGNTAALLVNNLTPIAGQSYRIICTLSGTGSVVINWGGMSSVAISATTTITLTPINATSKLSITPSNDFVGNVSLSIKTSSSAANQIQLPISISSGKSIWVDWGDGQYSTMNSVNFYANRIHTYTASGEYPVRVFGDDFSFGFGVTNVNDRLKIKSISSWGKLKIGGGSFYGCSKVTMSGITDIPDLTGVTNLASTFQGCSLLTTIGRINEWNTSLVTNMSSMFAACTNFNSDISNWNVSNVTSMVQMLYDARVFNQPIGNWERSTPGNVSTMSKVTSLGSMFSDAYAFNQPIGNWDLSSLVAMTYVFRRAYAFNQNLSNWNATKVTSFEYMFNDATGFNNGFASGNGVGNQLPWTINTSPTASVAMNNMFQGASAFNSNLGTGTTQWDVSKVTTFQSMFQGASKFNNGDDAAPINNWNIGGSVTGTITLESMFSSASAFNRDISGWDVSKVNTLSGIFANAINFENGLNTNINPVTLRAGLDGWNIVVTGNMYGVFLGASKFNRPLSNWNTTSVSWMLSMFQNAVLFNQDISSWNVGNVTNMGSMFSGATQFNRDLSKWNVGSVTSMEAMFYNADAFTNGSNTNTNPVTGLTGINGWNINTSPAASVTMLNMFALNNAFNQPIGAWNVSNVLDMDGMFSQATSFNQSLSNWERVGSTLANVTTMLGMFANASAFNNGELPGVASTLTWNTIGVTTMRQMFDGATAFNCNIGGFNVSACSDFGFMFRGVNPVGVVSSRFNNGGNASIGSWTLKTTGSIAMDSMFNRAIAFNQPIGSWNTSRVSTMQTMFRSTTAFNQNIGSWNVSLVSNFSGFMENKTFNDFSSTNLDAIYNGWIVNGVKPNISSPLSTNISFGTAKYTSAGTPGRLTLTSAPNNWIIQDGGI